MSFNSRTVVSSSYARLFSPVPCTTMPAQRVQKQQRGSKNQVYQMYQHQDPPRLYNTTRVQAVHQQQRRMVTNNGRHDHDHVTMYAPNKMYRLAKTIDRIPR